MILRNNQICIRGMYTLKTMCLCISKDTKRKENSTSKIVLNEVKVINQLAFYSFKSEMIIISAAVGSLFKLLM